MSSVKGINISRSEYEKVCKSYVDSLNSNILPVGCSEIMVSSKQKKRYYWNNANPYYTILPNYNFGTNIFTGVNIFGGARVPNIADSPMYKKKYYISKSDYKKACEMWKTELNELQGAFNKQNAINWGNINWGTTR